MQSELPLVGNVAPDFEAEAVFDQEFVQVTLLHHFLNLVSVYVHFIVAFVYKEAFIHQNIFKLNLQGINYIVVMLMLCYLNMRNELKCFKHWVDLSPAII